ncbi:MAG: hypothetical protein Q4D50_12025 [Eubacteriales bacterium]|nr:hypothetical protein [Eubacteriales bacterium]
MKLSPEERRRRQEGFRQLTPEKKLEHIWLYYKAPILLTILALGILVSGVYRAATKKDPVMYLAYLNVSVGEDMEARLTEDYLTCRGLNPKRTEMRLYRDLYLSDDPAASDHEYAYASRMKLLATINSKQLDLVLMNREAYDLCSASGYLLDLTNLVDSAYLTANQVILEDNAVEYNLNEAQEYIVVTKTASNALELTQLSAFKEAGFSDSVYIGIIANTPRLPECQDYLDYLISTD